MADRLWIDGVEVEGPATVELRHDAEPSYGDDILPAEVVYGQVPAFSIDFKGVADSEFFQGVGLAGVCSVLFKTQKATAPPADRRFVAWGARRDSDVQVGTKLDYDLHHMAVTFHLPRVVFDGH